jgi:hydrogenase maturation protease
MTPERLVIGIGNPDRGDDAAGVQVARKVHGGRTIEWADCSVLMELWDSHDDVIIVDAMNSGLPPGTVCRFDALNEQLPAHAFPSTHAFGVAETVELARSLGRLPKRLTIYGIEVSDLELGAHLSEEVADAVVRLAGEIDAELGGV